MGHPMQLDSARHWVHLLAVLTFTVMQALDSLRLSTPPIVMPMTHWLLMTLLFLSLSRLPIPLLLGLAGKYIGVAFTLSYWLLIKKLMLRYKNYSAQQWKKLASNGKACHEAF